METLALAFAAAGWGCATGASHLQVVGEEALKPGLRGRNPRIKYIREDIPPFELPKISGDLYSAKVPDTIDLAEMSCLLLQGIHGMCDMNYNAENFWRAEFNWKHPMMYHDENDWCEYKTYASSMLLRQACGSQERLDIEWHRMANLLQMRGPDGLLYIPLQGRPWAGDYGPDYEAELTFNKPKGNQMMPTTMSGRMLEAAAVYYLLTGDKQWKELVENSVLSIQRLAVDKGDYAYFMKGNFGYGEEPVAGPIPPPSTNCQAAWLAHGLITVYRLLGYEPALEFGYKLANFYRLGHSGFVGPQGEFRGSHLLTRFPTDRDPIHFHANTIIRMLLLEAGLAKGDKGMVELAAKGYEFGKKQGDLALGYYPEWCNAPYGHVSEICCVADMIYLALRQSTAGVADRWDDVDCGVRNMLAEAQLRETGWVEAYAKNLDKDSAQPYSTTDRVPERIRGVFGGYVAPNDWQGSNALSMISCCVGNGSMTLYRVWRDMIGYDAGRDRLSVHLLMNRASKWADIDSHIPYRGQVDVKVKQTLEVALRIPAWATPQEANCKVNGKSVECKTEGRYLLVRAAKGDKITLEMPIREEKRKVNLPFGVFETIVRGHDVVDISPGGKNYPLFQRARYRNEETQWRTVKRFISDRVIMGY